MIQPKSSVLIHKWNMIEPNQLVYEPKGRVIEPKSWRDYKWQNCSLFVVRCSDFKQKERLQTKNSFKLVISRDTILLAFSIRFQKTFLAHSLINSELYRLML